MVKSSRFSQGLFTWSGGTRSGGVGFFCFHALGDTKQKKRTPLDRGPPLHVNRVLVCVARAGGGEGGVGVPIPGLVQVNFATLYQTKLPTLPPLSQSSRFPETTEVTSTVQPKQNRFDFFYILEWQFPVFLIQTKIFSQLISLNGK